MPIGAKPLAIRRHGALCAQRADCARLDGELDGNKPDRNSTSNHPAIDDTITGRKAKDHSA